MAIKTYFRRLIPGLIASVAIGLAVTSACEAVVQFRQARPLFSRWSEVQFIYAALVASPFALLSVLGIRAVSAWVAGLCATIAFWVLVYLPHADEVGGGVDIGLALLLPFYPLFVVAVALLGLLPHASRDRD